MEKRKELNLGYSDFKSIIENNNYFVDKSLLIKDVIKAEKAVLLIPRPRRFGKTLNLSMLKYFFEINQPENKKLFEQLKIWQTENEIKQRQGKNPVIYLSFKDAKDNLWENCYDQIISEISDLYENNNFLLSANILTENEKKIFNEIVNGSANEVKYQRSLKKLSEYLYRYYNQKVVILIDEYDTPIQAGYKIFYDKIISFMRNLLSGAFKDNKYLYKGVITGILRVSRESIFSGLNNIGVYTILEERFSDCFGFTEPEVKQILTDFDVTTPYNEIKKWYNGYKFGNTSDIYNPWSILNYAYEYKSGFKPFWVNTSSDELIKGCLKERDANYTREQLLKLINNETIEKSIDENFVFPDLDTDKELLWTLLTFSGYLTTESKLDYNTFNLKIPNYEIKLVFKNIIKKWLSTDIKIKQTLLINTTRYLISKDIVNFEKGFKEIIGDTFSYFDTKGEPENVYQSYVLGLLAIIGDDYIIKSNRESGEGRYDIMLIPHDKNKTGIVIEIKQITRNKSETDDKFHDRINNKIEEALNQIKTNKYYNELLDNEVTDILKLPIVFAGKEPYISLIKKEKK
jgi:hypothetical protein